MGRFARLPMRPGCRQYKSNLVSQSGQMSGTRQDRTSRLSRTEYRAQGQELRTQAEGGPAEARGKRPGASGEGGVTEYSVLCTENLELADGTVST